MSPNGTISAERIWKRFRTDRPQKQLRDIGRQLRTRRGRNTNPWRWALRDVSLQVPPGESVGLIGANGSGKSTLLKILTRVMYPHAGRVTVRGRVGALIEVRAGIHPELTGKENIYLYGSLLGLPRREVAKRFEAIVDFAEVHDAIDRQVKFYSSGMQMRLGFGVAAFLEPDVLLVDEVLAVGDSAFQQRCLERMRTVLAQGTTLVYVSHDLASVEAVCSRALWLREGVAVAEGPVPDVLTRYREWIEAAAAGTREVAGEVRLLKVAITGGDSDETVEAQGPMRVTLVIRSPIPRRGALALGISEGTAAPTVLLKHNLHLPEGETEVRCAIPHLPLPHGRFYVWVGVFDGKRTLLPWHPAGQFDVSGPGLGSAPAGIMRLAPVYVDASWAIEPRS